MPKISDKLVQLYDKMHRFQSRVSQQNFKTDCDKKDFVLQQDVKTQALRIKVLLTLKKLRKVFLNQKLGPKC